MNVSVALCTYNGEQYLGEQLASLKAQTRLPTELVVTDDASSDRSVEIVEAFAAQAPFPVRLIRNGRNIGSTASFEQTMAACSGHLIAFCDQDDVWYPQKIERLALVLEADSGAGYAFSDADIVDQTLRPLGMRMWETVGFANGAWQTFRDDRQIEMLMERTRVTGATMMIRANRLDLCRPFPTGVVHDRWLATVLSAVGVYGVTVNEPLVAYRQHAGQQIGVARALQRRSRKLQMARDFVLAQRRRIRGEFVLGRRFIEQVDRLLDRSGALTEKEAECARRSRVLAVDRDRHVAARVELADASARRMAMTIVRELTRGAYHGYSGGLRAAMSDILFWVRYRDCEYVAPLNNG